MIQSVRRRLGLPLLTRRERRKLNGFWWASVTEFGRSRNQELKDRMAYADLLNEFLEAIEWLETLK